MLSVLPSVELEEVCALRIGAIGINFKTAPLALREKIARAAAILSSEKGIFFPFSIVVLSTCNRTEIYFGGNDLAAIHTDLLAWFRLIVPESFAYHLYSYFGIDCFVHLCRVTAGLDSAFLAETEIQRQVKVAYQERAARFALPSALHYIFQKALKVGKMIRSQYPLYQEKQSLFAVIWHLASRFFSDIFSKKILFVGYSEINRSLYPKFLRRGARHMTFCTTDPSSLAEELPCEVVGRDALNSWDSFDLIICASKADQYLIQGAGREGCLLFDLSVPRNIDPLVGQVSQLYNMEQINNLLESQQADVAESEAVLRAAACRLARIYRLKNQRVQDILGRG